MWRKDLKAFLNFVKIMTKEEQGHFCRPRRITNFRKQLLDGLSKNRKV